MRRENAISVICRGHSERHAVVAGLTMHLPEYAPVPEEESEICCISTLTDECHAVCELRLPEGVFTGEAAWNREDHGICFPADSQEELRRRCRWLAGLSLYLAVCKFRGYDSPWGGLSGVRPAKVAASILRRGCDASVTERMLCDCYLLHPDKAKLCTEAAVEEMKIADALQPEDAALYVGIPFCPTVCGYCSFVSRRATPDAISGYFGSLCSEIDSLGTGLRDAGYRVRALYIGGGTPTVLDADSLTTLCDRLRTSVDLSLCDEFTVEAGRPDTVTSEKLSALRNAGVGRICINPQTLSDEVLGRIGRRHSADDFRKAFRLARDTADWEINCDLIAGLPGESYDSYLSGLTEIISMGPEQITVHSLALKNASRMTEEGQTLSGRLGRMLTDGEKLLRAAGYRPYYIYRQKFSEGGENVGWMKESHVNAYNILMMEELCSVFAAGAGGVSKILRCGGLDRITNPKYPDEYCSRIESIAEQKRHIPEPYRGA